MEFYAHEISPSPSTDWTAMNGQERLELVSRKTDLGGFSAYVLPISALPTGFIYVEITTPLRASERGLKLREYESFLKSSIDESLTVWCEPVGDKSALRKLRGIEVKTL